jgi:hypothetical protein
MAVCTGSASLIPAERAELLTLLAQERDDLLRERAGSALLSQPLSAFIAALEGESPAPALFHYCGEHFSDNPEVALALIKHMRCPPRLIPAAARRLSGLGVQELLDNLDQLVARPEVSGALLENATLSGDQREQLQELLERTSKPRTAPAESYIDEETNPEKRITLLQRLSKMRVVERVQLALKGNREERMMLIRDPCKVVQRAVLQSPRLTEREIEAYAAMANLSEDVLRLIGRNRNFTGNPVIVRNLMNNPKTPLDISLHFLPNVNAQELKSLTLNRNIPETLRTMAIRLQRQRQLLRV